MSTVYKLEASTPLKAKKIPIGEVVAIAGASTSGLVTAAGGGLVS